MFILELAILILSILAGAYSLRSWWMSSSKPAEIAHDGSYVLRYNMNTFWLGLVSVFIGAGFLMSAAITAGDIETGFSLFLMGSIFTGGGIWLISEYFNNRLIVNNRYVRKLSWIGGDTIIDWARLDTVKFSSKSGNFVLEGMNGEKIRVSRLMRGFHDFERVLGAQVPESRVDQESMKDYENLQKMEQELLDEIRGIEGDNYKEAG